MLQMSPFLVRMHYFPRNLCTKAIRIESRLPACHDRSSGKEMEEMDLEAIVRFFPDLLARARHVATERRLAVIVVIDALDQLKNTEHAGSPTHALKWLPHKGLGVPFFPPARLNCVVSRAVRHPRCSCRSTRERKARWRSLF